MNKTILINCMALSAIFNSAVMIAKFDNGLGKKNLGCYFFSILFYLFIELNGRHNYCPHIIQHRSNKAKFIRWVVYTANAALIVV